MRFIHTASWHLGMSFSHVADKAEALRQARVDAVKQVVALAEQEKVDFVLAAGDLFDDNRISKQAVEQMSAAIAKCPVPVYLLPGCRDPLTGESPYLRYADLFRPPAFVLSGATPISLPNESGRLLPLPRKSRQPGEKCTNWNAEDVEDYQGLRIGIANGSEEQIEDLLGSSEFLESDFDYVALGHTISTNKVEERVWYSGSPEPTDFNQPDAGKVLLVEIAERSKSPVVREIPVYRFVWTELDADLHDQSDVDQLIDDLDEMADAQVLLRARVEGKLPAELLDRVQQISGERFFHFQMDLDVTVATDQWNYRHALLKEMVAQLTEKTAAGGEEARVARHAISMLSKFVAQAGFGGEEV
jgi:DNA repair exonuclease SbcCD nuclease subunit